MKKPSVRSEAGPNGRICSRCGSALDAGTPGNECARCVGITRSELSPKPLSSATVQQPLMTVPGLCAFCGGELGSDTRGDVCSDCLQSIHPAPQNAAANQDDALKLRADCQLAHGKFTLQKCLGTGGMGQVWLAVDNSLTRPNTPPYLVALKFLTQRLAAEKNARERLREEVLRGLQLNHDHIVRIHSWHEDTNEPVFYAMEYAEGETLSNRAEKLPGQRYAWIELAPIAKQLCEALAYAHARQVVHRDLKPGNILLTSNNVVKLADFGLAQSLVRKPADGTTTNPGGTPGYMSPQQCQGEPSKASDDIYALGATLYKALTGTTPISKDGGLRPLGEVLRQFRSHDVPPHVIQTITSCLAERPADRPASVEEVSQKLGFYTSWEGDFTPVARSRPRPRWLIPVISAAALGVAVLLVAHWISKPAPNIGDPTGASKKPGDLAEVVAGQRGLQVHLLNPAMSSSVTAPAAIKLDAAVEAASGTIQWVEFQTNKAPLARLTAPPYKLNWSSVAAGTYEISVVAADDKGVTASSAPVTVVVTSLLPSRGKAWTNSLGMEFLPMPGGGGWLCRYETRLVDYLAFKSNHVVQNMRLASFSQRSDRQPVVKVSWLDAGKFCQWLTEREQMMGLIGTQYHYRLPQVNEWRLALGSKTTAKTGFLWGSNWPPPPRIGNLRGGEWVRSGAFGVDPLLNYEDGVLYTAPVGTFSPNPNGFVDMVGNVWEFCEKRGKSGRMIAVALGGAWDTDNRDELRYSYEMPISPESLDRDDLGFRCLLDGETSKQQ